MTDTPAKEIARNLHTGATDNINQVMAEAIEDPESIDPHKLVVSLIQANYNDYASVTSMVIEGHENTIARLRAELDVIRMQMNYLFEGDYMPTESAILRAVFHPSEKAIEEHIARRKGKGYVWPGSLG